MTIPEALALAVQHHQAGRLRDAEALYRQILAVQPNHAAAWHYLGALAQQLGRHDVAVAWIRRALECQPGYPAAHNDLGNALMDQGQREEAVAAYRQAIQLQPDFVEAHNNLGIALAEQDRCDEAITAYRRALALRPDYAPAHNNLGNALKDRGQLDEALAAFHRALQLQPDSLETHVNLGNVLRQRGQLDEAMAVYRRALQLKPDYPEAHSHLGSALAEKGQLDEAMAAFRRALECNPRYPEAHYNLGIALTGQGQLDEGITAFRRALELKPRYPEAHNNLGSALKSRGQIDDAMAAYRRAIEIKPADAAILSNLIVAMPLSPAGDARSIREEQARWNRLYVAPLRSSWRSHGNNRDPERRLKIGYVSPSFRSNAVAFFLAPLLEAHDHERYEIYCYASVQRPDAITGRLRQSADVWRDVFTFPDAQLAECVRDDGIDILVDLSMHTGDHRLLAFARKPAPVQVSWLAYPGSTGMEAIDHRLTDEYIDPPGEEDDGLGGQTVRLPDAWCCYAPIEEFLPVGPLPVTRQGHVTFGSLNRFAKIHEGLLHCWAALLNAVPASRLLMICPEGQAGERTHALFATHGIARDRVELVAPCPWPDYIRLCERIDVALDASPCNGMTTTCHALWMGLPTVTLSGTSAVSRAGRSLLQAIALPEWIAQSEEQYIRIAAEGATDLPRLAQLRGTLRTRMKASPLMDAPRFARHIEAAYRTMWQRWFEAGPAETIAPRDIV